MSAGKGDKYRPVKKKVFDSNFDVVNWSSKNGVEIRNYIVKKGKKIYKYPWRYNRFLHNIFMPYKRIKQGAPFVFQELVFFSPRQFDEPVDIEDKEFIFRLKVCVNSGRCFTGPFYNEVIGEEEVTKKEIDLLLNMVENTPGIIISGREYIRYDDYGGLKKLYG